MRLVFAFALLVTVLFLTGCEQEATPFPIAIPPTQTPTPLESSLPALRYGISQEASQIVPPLGANSEIDVITGTIDPNRLGTEFDLLFTFGQLDGWTSTETLTIGLILLPLQPPTLNAIAIDTIAPQDIIDTILVNGATALQSPSRTRTQLRSELANMGRPDGFSLSVGYLNVPGAEAVANQLNTVNIDTRAEAMTLEAIQNELGDSTIQIGVIGWSNEEELTIWQEAFPEATITALYTLPLSVLVAPEYTIQSGPLGFPIINR